MAKAVRKVHMLNYAARFQLMKLLEQQFLSETPREPYVDWETATKVLSDALGREITKSNVKTACEDLSLDPGAVAKSSRKYSPLTPLFDRADQLATVVSELVRRLDQVEVELVRCMEVVDRLDRQSKQDRSQKLAQPSR
jgi:hypothetical protein